MSDFEAARRTCARPATRSRPSERRARPRPHGGSRRWLPGLRDAGASRRGAIRRDSRASTDELEQASREEAVTRQGTRARPPRSRGGEAPSPPSRATAGSDRENGAGTAHPALAGAARNAVSGPRSPKLWVRIYPDDCAVDSFEPPCLTDEDVGERPAVLDRGRGRPEGSRASGARRGAIWSARGAGRAAWIIRQYAPQGAEPVRGDPVECCW